MWELTFCITINVMCIHSLRHLGKARLFRMLDLRLQGSEISCKKPYEDFGCGMGNLKTAVLKKKNRGNLGGRVQGSPIQTSEIEGITKIQRDF